MGPSDDVWLIVSCLENPLCCTTPSSQNPTAYTYPALSRLLDAYSLYKNTLCPLHHVILEVEDTFGISNSLFTLKLLACDSVRPMEMSCCYQLMTLGTTQDRVTRLLLKVSRHAEKNLRGSIEGILFTERESKHGAPKSRAKFQEQHQGMS